jgi:hypothetical protein
MLEEFDPTIKHVAGRDNDAADALSRLDMNKEKPYDTITWEKQNKPLHYKNDKHLKVMWGHECQMSKKGGNKKWLVPSKIQRIIQNISLGRTDALSADKLF